MAASKCFDEIAENKLSLELPSLASVIQRGLAEMMCIQKHIKRDTIPLHCNLAKCYGSLGAHLAGLDKELKVAIAVITKDISKLPNPDYDQAVSLFLNHPSVEPIGEIIDRSDSLIKEQLNFIPSDNSEDPGVIEEVNSWFRKLICDDDIIKDTKINMDLMASIVAHTRARIADLLQGVVKRIYKEKTIIDVGIIRYPDSDSPFFKLYRIKVTAWSNSTRVTVVRDCKNGITGRLQCRMFTSRSSVIGKLKEESQAAAVKQLEAMIAQITI